MSQVDVLFPQNALSVDLRQSVHHDNSRVKGKREPSVGRASNHKGKHRPDNNTGAAVVRFAVDDAQRPRPAVNGDAREPKGDLPRRKKHRRGKKRKWKPYSKLTWEERKELQEREARRAERIRAEMCACGLTLAPYNTTQFLMEDHNLQEPDYDHIPGNHLRHRGNCDDGSSDEFYSSPSDEEDFLQQQFTETYRSMHAERLSDMSKSELVQELMSIEDRLETMQKRLNDLTAASMRDSGKDGHLEEQLEKIRVFEDEISKLSEENARLRVENEQLRTQTDTSRQHVSEPPTKAMI